jgi:RNA polymerase sigma factor (sigma-70 family)
MKRIYSSEKPNFGASSDEIKTYINQLRQGDETIWLVIYSQNLQRFWNYVQKLGKISETAAENLVEITYIKFLEKLKEKDLEHHNNLKSYFFTMLHNKTMDFFKKPNESVDNGDEWLARLKNEDDSAINAEKEAIFKLIDNALPLLKPEQKALIDLKYYTKPPMELEEIAIKLGITYVYARKIHERAKKKLRNFISDFVLQTK